MFPSKFKQPPFEPHCPLTILVLPLLTRPAQTEGWGSSRKACAAVWGSVLCLPHHCTHKKTKTSHYRWKQKYKTKNNDSKKQTEWKRPVGPASPIRGRRGRGRVCGVREGLVRGGGGERGHFKREADRLALRAGVWWECDRSESPGRGAALRPLRMLYRSHKREDRVKTFPQLSHPQNILSVTGRSHTQLLYHWRLPVALLNWFCLN